MFAKGHKVIGCNNLMDGYLNNVSDGAEFYQVDYQYLSTMNKLMKGVDFIYHTACAAYKEVGGFSPNLVHHKLNN